MLVAVLVAAGGMALATGGMGLGAGGTALLALPLGVIGGGLAARWLRSGAERRVLRALGARAVSVDDEPGLHNLTDGLCAVAGLTKPALYVIDDDARNSLAVGWDPRRAALVVTSGLLASLERIELEGVIAHELAHVKALDSRLGLIAAALAPLGDWAVAAVLGGDREDAADAAGVAITRYPPGLLRALEKVAAGSTVPASDSNATSRLWFAPDPRVGAGLVHRIEELREL